MKRKGNLTSYVHSTFILTYSRYKKELLSSKRQETKPKLEKRDYAKLKSF
jgi:hypothetical protein